MPNLMNHSEIKKLLIISLFVPTFQIEIKIFFVQFMVNILLLGLGSLDSHFIADLDQNLRSQNVADLTDPDLDPKHCFNILLNRGILS